jgi:hypothetical protein
MLDQSNLSTQRCRLIFWVECSVGGYLDLAKTIFKACKSNCSCSQIYKNWLNVLVVKVKIQNCQPHKVER